MINKITQDFLGTRFAIIKNYLVDYNLKIFYRIYKIQAEQMKDFNYNSLDNFIILVKRANYGDSENEDIYNSVA
ncbi:MAG: hypothetical protein ACP5TX_06595, partial [Thermoplasmata archaeon]